MQDDDYLNRGFSQGPELWLKQSKRFFEQSLPFLDHFLASPILDEEKALFALDEFIYYFKAQIKSQQSYFHFLPPIDLSKQNIFPKYFSMLEHMTEEAIDALHAKLKAKIKDKSTPQSMRDFYELWLDCGEDIYQKWLHQERFLAALAEIMDGMYR